MTYDSRETPGIPPSLGKHGFGDATPFDPESIARVRNWLGAPPRVTRWRSAGGLKALAEQSLGRYVASGDLIAACILSGFAVRHDEHDGAVALIGVTAASTDRNVIRGSSGWRPANKRRQFSRDS